MLTSTTAPGKTFSSRAELADHYKSDWHKYNLKRREAGLPLLEEADFLARWEAALAIRKEKEAKSQSGTDHLKHKRASAKKSQTPAAKKISNQDSDSEEDDEDDDTPMETIGKQMPKKLMESQENPSIDPTESLFDNHMSKSLEENVQYMHLKFGFFIPDRGTSRRECLDRLAPVPVPCAHSFFCLSPDYVRMFGRFGRVARILPGKGKARALLSILRQGISNMAGLSESYD
jgi:hypothetical protein